MKKSYLIYFHLAFWAIYFVLKLRTPNMMTHVTFSFIPENWWILGISIPLTFYLSYFGIMYLKRRKHFLYTIIIVIIPLFILLIISSKIFAITLYIVINLLPYVILGGLSRYFVDWFKLKEKQNKLKKQNLESELALLKTQLNPHFLFNTIHNIDALIKKQPDYASKSLIKLSDIMRYMLNDAKSKQVELVKEIEYLNNFFSLQLLRVSNPDSIKWDVIGSAENIKIAPMLFIPFLENAFKHGDTDNNTISTILKIDTKQITFSCVNSILKSNSEKDNTPGIGLKTIQRRLELLYPNKHKLQISKENDTFEVNLSIDKNVC